MVAALKLAITGGTGFVGQRLLDLALARGHTIRALTRRPQPPRDSITWVDGALDRPESLARLVASTDAVIHVAGVLNAPDAAAEQAGIPRFVHVSSLAAREPGLSLYGGSKARSEALVATSALRTAIVRPPAVYGPGDRETLDLFKMARRGQIFMPPAGRLSLIHVDDLASLLVALAASTDAGIIEPDDGRPGGWSHPDFGEALGRAVGTPARTIATPKVILSLASRIDRLVRGRGAKLTADRVGYLCHPDWVVDPARAPTSWNAAIPTPQGLADTAAWYRTAGWLD